MTLKELMAGLKIEKYPEFLEEIYDEAQQKYYDCGMWYLEEDFLKGVHEKYNFLGKFEEEVLTAAKQLKEDEYLCRYLALIRHIVSERIDSVDRSSSLILPKTDVEEDRLKTELMPFFAFPPEADNVYKFMTENNFPEDVIKNNMRAFAGSINAYKTRFGRPGYERLYLTWSIHFVECKIFKMGSLEFELKPFKGAVSVFVNKEGELVLLGDKMTYHKSGNRLGNPGFEDEDGKFRAHLVETDTYYEGIKIAENGLAVNERVRLMKSEWKRVLRPNDNVVNLHIPTKADMSEEALAETLKLGEEFIEKTFPGYNTKAFGCFSWLMDPVLTKMLRETSNIVRFQNMFMRFPIASGSKDVFTFLFKKEFERYEDIPETSSLTRAIKQYYLDGNCILKFAGVMFTDRQKEQF